MSLIDAGSGHRQARRPWRPTADLYFGAMLVAGPTDTATSPEAIHYEPAVLTPGTYSAQVCEFNTGDAPFAYTDVYATNDVAGTSTAVPYPPKWRFSRPTHL